MQSQYELEHYYSHGTWPLQKACKWNNVLPCKCVGICCDLWVNSLLNTGDDLTVNRAPTVASIVKDTMRERDCDLLAAFAYLYLNDCQPTNDKNTSTSTKQH